MLAGGFYPSPSLAQNTVKVNWDKITGVSSTTATLQVVVNPMLRRGSPIHDGSFQALKALQADYVRFVPWYPYPKLVVAELRPPTRDSSFWDFSYIDPLMEDVMKATEGHSVIINFSTIPTWMFKTDKPVEYPDNPDQVDWSYTQGTELRDTTMQEVADYYARLLSWYTKGGFTDELGKFHKSGHYYKIPYWEVLNEVDFEHDLTPQLYTRLYDAIVSSMKKVSPETKFVAMGLGSENNPEWFEYFLNPANHRPDIQLEGISYHFYGTPSGNGQTIDDWQHVFFDEADGFLGKVNYIESIRKRLAPQTFTTINEIGNIIGDQSPIPDAYWNLSGAMYAYIYVALSKLGIDIAGESQLVGYPTQYPDVSMMDWKNGKPNARYWVLKLIKDHFGPGDKMAATRVNTPDVTAQAYETGKGKKLLLINKRNKAIQLTLPREAQNGTVEYVNISTGENPPARKKLTGDHIDLDAFSVAVIRLAD
jgi:hypothetical protein